MDNAAASLEAHMKDAAKVKITNKLVNEIVFIMAESTFPLRTDRKHKIDQKHTIHDKLEGILKEALGRKGIPIDAIKNEVIEEYRANINETSKKFPTMMLSAILESESIATGINSNIGGAQFDVAAYTNIGIATGSGYKSLRDALNALSFDELAELQRRLYKAKHPLLTGLLRRDKWLI